MKRILTFLLVTFFTSHLSPLTSTATTYNGQMMIVVNGVSGSQTANIDVVKQTDGRYTFSLRNFVLDMGESQMPVGNITLSDIDGQEEGDKVVFHVAQDVNIEDGDREDVPMWVGPALGPVPITLTATLGSDILHTVIDIFFAPLGQTIRVIFDNSVTQIPNSDFEAFHEEKMSSFKEDEADHWHSFLAGTGELISSAAAKHTESSTDVRPGSEGSKSLLVKSTAVKFFGVTIAIANGTVTTGRLKAGDMSADSPLNCAFADMSKAGQTDDPKDAHGDPFYTRLNALPDSLVVWVKFNQKKALAKHPYATISAAITDGTYYQDPEDKAYTNVVARAANREIASTNQWQRISIPFVYTGNAISPRCILVTMSTNADAGQGNEGDELYVDDLALIYNHRLTSLKIKGHSVPDFAPDKLEYNMEIAGDITEDDIVATVDGKGATTSVAIIGDEEEGKQALVTVVAADLTAVTTYVVNLTSSTGIELVHSSECIVHSSSPIYDLQGRIIMHNSDAPSNSQFSTLNSQLLKPGICIVRMADGTTRKIIVR